MKFVSTAQKTQLCIFADGSFDQTTKDGGYALAHTGFAPAPSEASVERQVAKGWSAIPVTNSPTCEGLAIAQSFKEAMKELTILEKRVATRPVDTASAGGRMEASVITFSDSKTVLEATKRGKFPKSMKHMGHAIIKFSEELKEKFRGPRSRLKVNLVVHWIPGHYHTVMPLHSVADRLSRKCRQDRQPFLLVDDTYVQ